MKVLTDKQIVSDTFLNGTRYVPYEEAQAEIARLRSEVERLKAAYINATEKRMPEDITKAHNNAVRRAANQVIAGDTVTNTQRRILSLLIPAQREDE